MTGPVRSVSQAFAILRLLAETQPLTLSDIVRLTGLSPSSCLNLLKTLAVEGTVEREARGKRYRLAPAWAAMEALRDGAVRALIDRALPLMTRFADAQEAAVGLWKIVSRERMRLAAHAESAADGMRLRLADAQRQPLGGGAAGRAFAAAEGVDAAELARRFAAVRWQAELGVDDYIKEVRDAAHRGFAVDRGYAHRGIWTVAALMAGARTEFCLSASVFAGSRSAEELDALGAELSALSASLVRVATPPPTSATMAASV